MFGAKSPWELNLVFDVVRDEPGITAQTFANYDGDPIQHPVVATALARKLVNTVSGVTVPTPEQAAARAEAVQRVSDIIVKTTAGQQLVSGPAPEKAKLEAWAAIIANPKIAAKTFTSDNPFANTLLTDSIAPLYAVAGTVQEYPGESLRNLAGFALGLRPTFPKGIQFTAEDVVGLQQALKKGTPLKDLPPAFAFLFTQHSLFPKNEVLDKFVSSAKSTASTNPIRGAFEFNALFTELGPISCPAFRVQVGDFDPQTGGVKFGMVDNTGRTYADREDFLHHNQLPAGVLYYAPYNALGPRDKNGVEILGRRDTPATDSRVENAVNKAALVGCFAAGIVAVVASGGTLALAAGAVGGAGAGWDTYRGLQALADRAAHGQSNNPFASGDEGRQAFMLEMGVVASGTNLGAFGVAGGFLGMSKLGAIAKDAKWAMPVLSTVRTGAAGVNIAALSVTAADLATNWEKMAPDERNVAAAMLVFYGVLAAKPVFELRAQATAAKPVQASEPLRPAPEPPSGSRRPASLPTAGRSATLIDKMRAFLTRLGFRDLAGKFEAELATWAELRAARGEPTTPRDIANKIAELAKAHKNELGDTTVRGLNKALANPDSQQAPAQNGARGVDFGAGPGNDNATPSVEPNQAHQHVPLAANGGPVPGGPSFVPTGLDPARPSGASRPPGQRWPSSPPGHQAPPTPAATPASPPPTGAGPGGHPVPPSTRRAGSTPRPGSEPERPPAQQPAPEPTPDTEPTIVHPIIGGGATPDTALCTFLKTHRQGLWEQIPPECRTSDTKAANWLHDKMGPEAWKDFANWLRNNNYDAYSSLPDALKLPTDVRPVAPVRGPAPGPTDNALEGKLVAWLKEKEMWDAVPAEFRTSERKLAQWVHDVNPKQWDKFLRWLSKEHNDVYRRTQPDSLIHDDRPAVTSTPARQNTQRGGRQLSPADRTAFVEELSRLLPRNPEFRRTVIDALNKQLSQDTNVSIANILQTVHDCASKSFGPDAVAYLDHKLKKMVPEFTPGVTTPNVVAGELGGGGPRFKPDNVLPLDVVATGLRPQ